MAAMSERSNGIDPLRNFLKAARGCSQEKIIVEFLEAVIDSQDALDGGSVLIADPERNRLVLFNEGEVLFNRNFLDAKNKSLWCSELPLYGSTAGKCLRMRCTIQYKAKDAGEEYIGESPIKNMVCIPIETHGKNAFGVVCFHNNVDGRPITEELTRTLEIYVDALAVALHTPHPELQIDKNVFIVHGHDGQARAELENILFRNGATPKVLMTEDKNAESLLVALENLIRICKAGFILVTPDDEGRLRGSNDDYVARARENVIFEMGLLFARFRQFQRVSVLLKEPTKLPSDLGGIAYERFARMADIETQIVTKLRGWGIRSLQ